MSHWPYIIASYVLTIGGMAGLALWSWLRMVRAEKQAEALSTSRSSRAQSRGAGTDSEKRPSTSLGTSGISS
ncbi:MAG TPA: heme exporter protein CcmD [Sphingomonas sp.]|nr:heme exporter protein CcmD [Sphingomonas sp.]